MSQPQPPARRSFCVGVVMACVLAAWNGLLGLYANPMSMTTRYDGTQYQLLVRNRLSGHYELGDTALTVRREGSHPMWRPGIVWIEEALVPATGSVGQAAAVASVIGTTLNELVVLWLAYVTFGGWTTLAAFGLLLLLPLKISSYFAVMAICQGPETWAAAALALGLALLVMAFRRPSAFGSVAAGVAAGLSEVFRTANLFVFAGACAVFVLRDLVRRDRRRLAVTAGALAAFAATSALAGRLVPSEVDKNVANVWAIVLEQTGPRLIEPTTGQPTVLVGGLKIVPGSDEAGYDYLVHHSRGDEGRAFLNAHAGLVWTIYVRHLGEVLGGGAAGFRGVLGGPVLVLLAFQVVMSLVRRDESTWQTLAFGGSVLAYYLGPLTLVGREMATHYLVLVMGPSLVLAAQGVVGLAELVGGRVTRWWPAATTDKARARLCLTLVAAPAVCVAVLTFRDVIYCLCAAHDQARQDLRALDALNLGGRRVACRSMTWFVDRDVQTVLLPYATVPELERYAVAHDLDGLLFWDDEELYFFRVMPEDDDAMDRLLRASPVFGSVQQSGAWRYYPVRRSSGTGD